MTTVVIHPNTDEGATNVVVMVPNLECGLTLEQIIAKDVPPGVPYKVVDYAELPQDPMFFNAWEWQD